MIVMIIKKKNDNNNNNNIQSRFLTLVCSPPTTCDCAGSVQHHRLAQARPERKRVLQFAADDVVVLLFLFSRTASVARSLFLHSLSLFLSTFEVREEEEEVEEEEQE